MTARLRSWRQKIQQHPVMTTIIIVAGVLVAALILVIVLGYWFNWSGVGVNGGYSKITTTSTTHGITTTTEQPLSKTLWDWLQLLIIPVVLVVGGFLLNFATSRTEREVASDKQREDALQAYIDNMSALLLEKNLRKSGEDDEARKIARVRTMTVLPRLDKKRKGSVLQFLHESGLIDKGMRIVDLTEADLREADLYHTKLSGADLSGAILEEAELFEANGADLHEANLVGANLSSVNLKEADLSGADLSGAYLFSADLSEANLKGANLFGAYLFSADLTGADLSEAILVETDLRKAYVTTEQLNRAKSLQGATMPDGSKHP